MATTTVSIGSNQSIDTETPSGASGSNPYTVTFGTNPNSNVAVGDIMTMDDSANTGTTFIYLLTGISGSNYTVKYCSGGSSADSPTNITDEYGDQQDAVFKRAFSTISLFEAMVDDSSPSYWASSDDVVGELHSDSTFTDATVNFDQKQSLSSVKLTVNSDDRHDGTAESGALWKPTSGSGHNQGILRIDIDDMIAEWLDISLDSLNSANTNKAIVLVGTNDDNIIRNNLIHDKGGNPGNTGPFMMHQLGAGSSGDTLTIQNNIIYNVVETSNDNAAAMLFNAWSGTVNIYNNTIYNIESQGGSKVAIGIRSSDPSGSTSNVKNNIVAKLVSAASNGERAFEDGPANGSSGTFNEAYNLSDDTSATIYDARGTGSLANKSLAEIDFVSTSAGSEDLHLDTSSVCLEAGVDLGTTNGVNIDIDGVDRDATGVTWDIGADQKSTASSTGSPAFFLFMD
jgi:hypothetical protein